MAPFSRRVYLDNREIVPLNAISPEARRAVLAIEDSDFFEHGALDWSSLIRALIQNAERERSFRAARRSRSNSSAAPSD